MGISLAVHPARPSPLPFATHSPLDHIRRRQALCRRTESDISIFTRRKRTYELGKAALSLEWDKSYSLVRIRACGNSNARRVQDETPVNRYSNPTTSKIKRHTTTRYPLKTCSEKSSGKMTLKSMNGLCGIEEVRGRRTEVRSDTDLYPLISEL